jgi:plastocyanin
MRRLAAPLAVVALVAGCGGDDEDKPGRTVTVGGDRAVEVTAHEYSFDPERIVIEGSGPRTIELRNDGDLAHNLRLRRHGREVDGTPTITSGRTAGVLLPLERGKYELLCTVGDHAELGMTGELEVK